MEFTNTILVIAIGILAGFINVMAAGGSLLSLPLLMFMGLPANVANGTNRIAILLQNIIGVASFKQQKIFEWNYGLKLSIPALVGAIVGVNIAVTIDNNLMSKIIGMILAIMFVLILLRPKNWLSKQNTSTQKFGLSQMIVFFFIGIYGGFIQAGVGFFLISGLVLSAGLDLVKTNAIKLLIILVYTPVALLIFFMNDQVDLTLGITLSIGNMLGAFIASRIATKINTKIISYFLLSMLFISSAKLLGLFELLF